MLSGFLQDYKNNFKSNLWSLLTRYFFLTFYGLFKYLPTPVGDVLRSAYLKFFLKELHTLYIREGITFHFPENISIGRSAISEFVHFNGFGGIQIGDKVIVGAGSRFFSHDHEFSDLTKPIWHQGLIPKPIVIKDNVYIGCNVTVLGNVTVNEGAVIGACSVVTENVPENAIVVGIPGKVIGYRGSKSTARDKDLTPSASF